MKDDGEFRRHGEEVLHTLHRLLGPAADDFGFEVHADPGELEIEFAPPRHAIKATLHPAQRQIWLVSGAKTHRLTWDVVENSFVLGETGQTLQELLEEAISERVGEDVSF